SGELLGGMCVGPSGGELIHEIVVAMVKRMTAAELALAPHYHPTLAEIWTYPAEELARRIASRSRVEGHGPRDHAPGESHTMSEPTPLQRRIEAIVARGQHIRERVAAVVGQAMADAQRGMAD